MLSLLRISNIAIIESTSIEFGSGLNVITGETGSGKSILLKSIELLTGIRAGADLLRTGESSASIEAIFEVESHQKKAIAELLPEFEGEELIVRREIRSGGKSRVYIDDRLSTLTKLGELTSVLLDITAQHAQQNLTGESTHREMLDSFGTPAQLLASVSEAYSSLAALEKEHASIMTDSESRRRRIAELENVVEDLGEAALKEGEKESLQESLSVLENSESLLEDSGEALALMNEETQNIESQLQTVSRLIARCADVDARCEPLRELIDSCLVELQEASMGLSEYRSRLELDPDELEEYRARLAEIARLERRYAMQEAELIQFLAGRKSELESLRDSLDNPAKLEAKIASARQKLEELETELTAVRTKNAKKLEKLVETQLKQLSMQKARFRVEIEKAKSSSYGANSISFSLSANLGEEFKALSKTASGGELSRLLLALKVSLGKKAGTGESAGTHIFDEIDSGIGGATAQIVGEKLKAIAANSQVILITHAPQIAAFADHHFAVSKSSSSGRTRSAVEELGSEGRVAAIASMLAGTEVSSQFQDSAQELLRQAG